MSTFTHSLRKKLREGLVNAAVVMENVTRNGKDVIRQNYQDLMTDPDEINLFEEKLKFDESMENQSILFTQRIADV